MDPITIFIGYRRNDGYGEAIAKLLGSALPGQQVVVRRGAVREARVISVYLDQNALAIPDWTAERNSALQAASAFILICSPGAVHRHSEDDELYREIDWWVANRRDECPILIVPFEARDIPTEIAKQWPKAQYFLDGQGPSPLQVQIKPETITKILRSVETLAFSSREGASNRMADSGNGIISPVGLFVWAKDNNYRYVNCNENYARAAGFDSPRAMLGKTDYDMPWRKLADTFRAGDHHVISGLGPRVHVQEKEITVDGEIPILVWEEAITVHGKIVGLEGYFIDTTGIEISATRIFDDKQSESRCLGPVFDNQYLSRVEVIIFEAFLRVADTESIAGLLGLTKGEVAAHLRTIKWKLQCKTEGDLRATATRAGLPLTLFGLTAKKAS